MNQMIQSTGFYGNLEVVENRMANLLLSDKEFVKYLHYNNKTPLDSPDVKNPLKLLDSRFFLQPKPATIVVDEGIIVEMFLGRDNPETRSGGMFTEYIITFNIICHLNSWGIKNGKRPYRVMNIIDKAFNGHKIDGISFGKIRSLGSQFIKFADHWEGYKLAYVLSWNGNLEC